MNIYYYELVDGRLEYARMPIQGYVGNIRRWGRWPSVSQKYREVHGICERCGLVVARSVHHIKPIWVYVACALIPRRYISPKWRDVWFHTLPFEALKQISRVANCDCNLSALCDSCHVESETEATRTWGAILESQYNVSLSARPNKKAMSRRLTGVTS